MVAGPLVLVRGSQHDHQPHKQAGVYWVCGSGTAREVFPPLLELMVLGQLVGLPDLDYTFGVCLLSRRFEGFVPNWDEVPFSVESPPTKQI